MPPFEQESEQSGATEAKQALMDAGDQAYDAGDFAAALDRYHRACLLERSDPRVWCALGMTYYSLEFNREAWRSYLLALMCGPADPDTLWYCAEFIAGVGGTELARILLQRYLDVELDEGRLAEARELLASLPEPLPETMLSEPDLATAEQLLAGDVSASAGADGIHVAAAENLASEPTEDAVPEADEYLEAGEGIFIATLSLQLEGVGAHCQHCSTGIPYDAPYCYACLMPHFYKEV